MHQTLSFNNLGRDFIIGDLHGSYNKLLTQLEFFNFNTSTDRLLSVGDLVDRGSQSFKCLSLLNEDWFYAVRGNHEQMIINYFENPKDYASNINDYIHWHKTNGGSWFYELSETDRKQAYDLVKRLPLLLEVPINVNESFVNVGVCHAEVDNWSFFKTNLNNSYIQEKLLWSREKWHSNNQQTVDGINFVFVGHTPVNSILTLGNVFYIDTGAYFKDRPLTCLDIKLFLEENTFE